MQGLRCHFISMLGKSPTQLKVTSRHDHSCLLDSNQQNQQIDFKSWSANKSSDILQL